ncbi:MAG TPA: 1-(5-phosphoribosyl)-5-[(5-phosphoribosylamino)methylideneamino]imidazole-4-carboxamide isomerase [Nitrospirae bacterium]|nr:1-(5-phosphoribosyl)-5-[(5-phosphoribosylamino) methylideneamino] imidazole-4-carboxamide isomerase [bacterium BMS3Abin10]GBE38195.1 1-(5-phosphoribosyl)-5-[(5-phosphoribosylamino) methylideneamino] imidazole-4-carboxamide isomerase [bacterium BMS3Bbin08]HDH51795.1 1-(5-phosphoribosyl)-5-[(5-phosphoribosylamino)methylideneamino]imidazole-4-carboxamide isomerase [Nitrospirota bacterium]HDK16824.1 1-(5-phosphoribosyl)-5-[(5-phosphoribosylamino)methylideneamino]imidazole-4-carboxamide isomerase 
MIVIPAIDLKDGKCVRLLQGRKEDVTVYSEDPVSTAEHWAGLGAELLHVVDLDGAFTGVQKNLEVIKAIRKAIDIPVQLGGGIRDIQRIEKLIDLGIDRTIIGTSAASDPDMLKKACERFPGKVLVGIDAKDGKVAIKGWEEVTELDAVSFAKQMQANGTAGIIYTDISRDGMLSGPNIEAMAKMVHELDIPVIASGGVSSIDDIENLMKINDLWGVITGKALYSGSLLLKDAIEAAKKS